MAEKLIVEKFGPIKKIELELNKILILIGPQSTGKSTIAKLVAILRSFSFLLILKLGEFEEYLEEYKIESYLKKDTFIRYESKEYSFVYQNGKGKMSTDRDRNLSKLVGEFLTLKTNYPLGKEDEKLREEILEYTNFYTYIPTERVLIPVVSSPIMNFIQHDIPAAKILTKFAADFEKARQHIKEYEVDFLGMTYKFMNNENRLYLNERDYVKLSEASSGLQALLPMLLVIRYIHERDPEGSTFVIEEPELNLYPKSQYELTKIIAAMCTGFNPGIESYDELIITTHSPYILTAFNNFLLAYKFKNQNEISKEVSKIIPENSWVNADHFNAYYLGEKGAVKIFDEKMGLIAGNQLDSASESIMADFDNLMDLYSETFRDEK